MTADELGRIGETLYGGNWIGPMAIALEINVKTVRRWSKGDQVIPMWLGAELVKLTARRRQEISELMAEMAASEERI